MKSLAREVKRQFFEARMEAASVSGNVVKGVVLLGRDSKNVGESGKPRVYTEAAMKSAVDRGIYEGVQAYIDHVENESDDGMIPARPTRSLLGVFKNVSYDEAGQKVKGDLVVSARESWFLEDAKNPDLARAMGFSHDAFIDTAETDKAEEVTAINEALSVDLVTRPATTKGVFESMTKRKKGREADDEKPKDEPKPDEKPTESQLERAKRMLAAAVDMCAGATDKEASAPMLEAISGALAALNGVSEALPEPEPEPGDESPKDDEPMDPKMTERVAKLEAENSRLKLASALSKFPAKAQESALKRLTGKALSDADIEGEVKALEELQSAFATAPGVDPAIAGVHASEAVGGADAAALMFQAFGSFGGKPSARERAVALAKE